MVKYLVRAGDWSNASFKTLKEARSYAYRHTRSDSRSHIYSEDKGGYERFIGIVYKYDLLYWKGSGGSAFLYPDGSIKYLSPKKKSKARTNEFGLDWNLK